MAKLQSMTLEPKSSTKQMGSIHRLGSKEVIPLETIDPEADPQGRRPSIDERELFSPSVRGLEYEPHPEDYEQLPIEFRPALPAAVWGNGTTQASIARSRRSWIKVGTFGDL